MKGCELYRGLLQHRGIRDRVAAIDCLRLVTGHSHWPRCAGRLPSPPSSPIEKHHREKWFMVIAVAAAIAAVVGALAALYAIHSN